MPPASPSESVIRIVVEQTTDVAVVQTVARRFAMQCGFSGREQWEFAIAVSETASNMVKYANGGRITLRHLIDENEREYLEFESRDKGLGIASIDLAVEDSVSEGVRLTDEQMIHKRRGLGLGLGAIRRLMDKIEIENMEKGGVRVVGRKYRS